MYLASPLSFLILKLQHAYLHVERVLSDELQRPVDVEDHFDLDAHETLGGDALSHLVPLGQSPQVGADRVE